MKPEYGISPLKFKLSFKKLWDEYKQYQQSENFFLKARLDYFNNLAKEYPYLFDGSMEGHEIEKHLPEIRKVLEDIFPAVLTKNEIKLATLPYTNVILHSSERLQKIISHARNPFSLITNNLSEDQMYIITCCTILSWYYGYDLQFNRPIYYEAEDENGMMQKYRVLYNGDFMDIYPTEKAKQISKDDVNRLLKGFGDMELWKELFPPDSWVSEGFAISNMYNATIDTSISDLKTNLLKINIETKDYQVVIEDEIRKLFNIPDLKVGLTIFEEKGCSIERPINAEVSSFILVERQSMKAPEILCESSFKRLIKDHGFFAIPDVEEFLEEEGGNNELSAFKAQGIQSAILAPILKNNKLYGILELVSTQKYALNSVNAIKLNEILPNIAVAITRIKQEVENRIEAIIQKECTSIHPSVYWRFEQEAKNYLRQEILQERPVFSEIVFSEVYPLYGQTDIKDSSKHRNSAIQRDFIIQLSRIWDIMFYLNTHKVLELSAHILKIDGFIKSLLKELKSDSEHVISLYIKEEIHPIFEKILLKPSADDKVKDMIHVYFGLLDPESLSIYSHRKNFDQTVTDINETLMEVLDDSEAEAQAIYPHFFGRYKTDGVEFDVYVGESITKTNSFKMEYLYALRLWQLQVVFRMENAYSKLYNNLMLKLNVTSMILVYNMPMGIRFRMDEKRFDVDGTYNVRYEVIKKRIDKAFVKGSTERVNKENHLSIIYSNEGEREEYLAYIEFLQTKGLFGSNIEILELERQQGISGLKALRVEILKNQEALGKLYTYEDFIAETKKFKQPF